MDRRRTSRSVGRWLRLALPLLAMATMPACTLAKPLVGAVTGPVLILGNGGFEGCHCGEEAGYLFCFMAALGAAGGLVTGAISDVQVLTGAAGQDPAANWWHPFKTNTDTDR